MTGLTAEELKELNFDAFSFYDGADELSDEEIQAYKEMGFDEEDLVDENELLLDKEFLRPHSSEMKDIFRE